MSVLRRAVGAGVGGDGTELNRTRATAFRRARDVLRERQYSTGAAEYGTRSANYGTRSANYGTRAVHYGTWAAQDGTGGADCSMGGARDGTDRKKIARSLGRDVLSLTGTCANVRGQWWESGFTHQTRGRRGKLADV